MSETSMHDLAARLARGEEAAFAELYDVCAGRLHHYLSGLLGSHDAASDVLQTAFLRIVKSRRRFRGVEKPVAYLFQVARNEALREIRRRGHKNALPLAVAEPLACGDKSYGDLEDADAATAAIERLSPDDREIVELKIIGGLTFSEIADIVGRPQATVATRYRRALQSLRGWFEKQCR